mgnify:CR=1 FL=1
MTLKIDKTIETDVVVIGGGAAGVGAAVASARAGLDVYLLETSYLLGGIIAKSPGMPIDGAYFQGEEIGGLTTEYIEKLFNMNPPAASREDCLLAGFDEEITYNPDLAITALFQMVEDAGVNLLTNATALDVTKDGDSVKEIIYSNRSGLHKLKTEIVIDTSGDGDVAAKAGVPFDKGDKDKNMMAGTLTFFMGNVDMDKFPEDGDPFNQDLVEKGKKEGKLDDDFYNIYMIPGYDPNTVFFNCPHVKGVDGTDPSELTKGANKARERALQLIRFIKEEIPAFSDAFVQEMAPTLGIRETRRLEGLYKLTEDDLLKGKKFADGIVCCDSTIDDVLRGEDEDSKVTHVSLQDRNLYYQVPFRSLVPKNISNLLFAGRCLSAELPAFASARGIATSMAMGQACGVAADMAISNNSKVQDLDFAELVKKLKEKGVNGLNTNIKGE